MNMTQILKTRRSTRQFIEKEINEEKCQILKEALLRSPTGHHLKTWRFAFVKTSELIIKLADARPTGSAFLKNAKLVVVIAGIPEESDVWLENCHIAATILQLQAHDLDLGSCWVQVRLRQHNDNQSAGEYIKEVLTLPKNWEIACMIGLGYPEKPFTSREIESNDDQKIIER